MHSLIHQQFARTAYSDAQRTKQRPRPLPAPAGQAIATSTRLLSR